MKLPSGAELVINLANLDDALELQEACAEELKLINFDAGVELDYNFFKNVFCAGIASKKIKASLWKCMERCTYNKLRATKDIFEAPEARGDLYEVFRLVGEANIAPFVKPLLQKYSHILEQLKGLAQKLESPTTQS